MGDPGGPGGPRALSGYGARTDPRQREIVQAYFFEGRTEAEIAQRLGIAQQVVSRHLFGVLRAGRRVGGAMAKLRKLAEALGIDPEKWV